MSFKHFEGNIKSDLDREDSIDLRVCCCRRGPMGQLSRDSAHHRAAVGTHLILQTS